MPTTDQVKSAQKLMATASLDTIRLVKADAFLDLPSKPPSSKMKHRSIKVSVEPPVCKGKLVSKTQLDIVATFSLHGTGGPGSRTKPDLQITCSFELTYSLPKNLAASEGEIDAFCQTNAMLNSWPYWREFVQSTVVRMNMPPLVLPLFRLAPVSGTSHRK